MAAYSNRTNIGYREGQVINIELRALLYLCFEPSLLTSDVMSFYCRTSTSKTGRHKLIEKEKHVIYIFKKVKLYWCENKPKSSFAVNV
jgi:hypothetical protein